MQKCHTLQFLKMDKTELENWKKVKDALEKADKTDSMFYTRAVAIVKGQDDPLDKLK